MDETTMDDAAALDEISALLEDELWQLGTLTRIAELVRSTGRGARDHPTLFLSSSQAADGHQAGEGTPV